MRSSFEHLELAVYLLQTNLLFPVYSSLSNKLVTQLILIEIVIELDLLDFKLLDLDETKSINTRTNRLKC